MTYMYDESKSSHKDDWFVWKMSASPFMFIYGHVRLALGILGKPVSCPSNTTLMLSLPSCRLSLLTSPLDESMTIHSEEVSHILIATTSMHRA